MNKRVLITILVILGLAIITGSFWYVKNQQKENVVIKEKQEQNQQQKNDMENMKKNQNQKIKTERETIQTEPQLSPEEIEKLRKEKDLVWYEIPELGIKFLVTKDTKEDLRYKIKKETDEFTHKEYKTAIFYDKYIYQIAKECKDRYDNPTCHAFIITQRKPDDLVESMKMAKKKYGQSWIMCAYKLTQAKENVFCYFPSTTDSVMDNKERKKYLDLTQGKSLEFYIKSVVSL